MKSIKQVFVLLLCFALCAPLTQAYPASVSQQESPGAKSAQQDVTILIEQEQVRFTSAKAVAEMQLQVFDQTGQPVFDSGAATQQELAWAFRQANGEAVKSGLYSYTLTIKEAGAESARVRRGHFIVDRAHERDGQTDRLWVTSQNNSNIGAELTIVRNEGVTIAGASLPGEQARVATDNDPQHANANSEPKAKAETKPAALTASTNYGRLTIQGSEDPLLEINHTGNSGFPAIWFKQDGAAKAYMWWDRINNSLRFGTHDANPVMTMLKGNVGIGTTTPTSRLEIAAQDGLGITGFQPFLTLRDTSNAGARARIQNVAGGLNFQTDYLTLVGGSAMYIQNSTQWVGVGTTAPQARLHVQGTTMTGALKITGGADFAENFEINPETELTGSASKIETGVVVSIDPANPGKLTLCAQAYDRRVAGVISGAGGINPGLVMNQEGTLADGNRPVALSGRVYVWVDASKGAIQPGDLLTTSSTPGHAMKATDAKKAQGAIIGKAMTSLKEGKGLVLVLVTLQ